MQFNPKILGLNVGIFGTVFRQSGTEFLDCYWTCVLLFFCVVAGKLNNMLVV